MRVAVVAGPIRACVSGDRAVPEVPGRGRRPHAADRRRMAGCRPRGGLEAVELAGWTRPTPRRRRCGAKLHRRAARMAALQRAATGGAGAGPGGLRRDHGVRGMAAELLGRAMGGAEPASAVPAVEGAAADRQRSGAGDRRAGSPARLGDARMTARSCAAIASASAPASTSVCPPRSRSAATTDRHAARLGGASAGLARRGRRRGAAALRAHGVGARVPPGTGRWWSSRRPPPTTGTQGWPSSRWRC